MKQSLIEKKEVERKFLEQLMDSSKLENYKVEVPIKAELRKYQQVSLFWKYGYMKMRNSDQLAHPCRVFLFSWPGRSPGRAIVLPPALASALASASGLAKC